MPGTEKMSSRVLAALSGGVDSSVAALLLKEMGHEVSLVTMKLFAREDPGPDLISPGARDDLDHAREAAGRLGLSHQVADFRDLFRQEVIDPFAAAYAQGLTPNPCLDCNRHIKFGLLGDMAARMGCDFLATGHYVRREFDARRGRWLLKTALDQTKDQGYVLYGLTQAQLARTLFPLGEMSKAEVRALAAARGLANADQPDSQDICFIPNGDYASFLEKTLGLAAPPGDFIDRDGRVLGRHRGLIRYTIGQRRGLGSFGRPRYVTGLNPDDNTVRLGPEEDLFSSSALVGAVNLISETTLDRPLVVSVKIRYNSSAEPAVIEPHPAGLLVKFETPRKAVTPGQAAVFYQDDLVVGGGVILKSSCP